MKIEDGPLNRYLIKNLQPLTEADPSLLANYVAALLKNNKPKKELQKLCIDQLYDFLGDGTKSFVAKLFQSLEDGTVPSSAEEMEANKSIESGSAITSTDVIGLRTSPPHLERLPSTALRSFSDEGEDESSDDEDDDRNHKHRRRVTPSRSFERDGEDEADRGLYRKRGRSMDNGQFLRGSDREGSERRGPGHSLHSDRDVPGKFDRRLVRDHGSARFNGEGGQRGGMRIGPQFRGEGPGRFEGPNGIMRGNMGRGRGIVGSWVSHDQRFPPQPFPDVQEFAPPLLSPGPPAGFFPGRSMPSRSVPHTPWPGYGPLSGMGNGPLEHLSGGMQGVHGPPTLSAGMGMNINIGMGRRRCLDFEERGYCLRGDLCPMEHGANRIVVEDVQSLSKFNLPVSLPSGRGIGIGPASGPSSGPMLPPGLGFVNRSNRGNRETSLPALGEDPALLNGGAVPGIAAGAEPDSYDPDQPLWNKDRPEASSGLRKLPSFQKGSHDEEWEGDSVDKRENREGSESMEIGRVLRIGGNTNGGSQMTDGGPSVWDRIGPVPNVGSRLDGGLRPGSISVDVLHSGKQARKDNADDAPPRVRGTWQGKWNREVESDEDSVPRGFSIIPLMQTRGRGSGRGDAGTGQRSGEGTSYGSRGTGGRSSNGFGTERAQRTLYVSFIPPNCNRFELLLAHFQKFGNVLDIRIPAHSDRAFVQFSQREDAESALTAPDAVMGNRFIRLSWANRDSIPDPSDNAASTSGSRAVKSGTGISSGTVEHVSKVVEKAVMNGCGSVQVEQGPIEGVGKLVVANGSSSTPAIAGTNVKKQEELERMREEIRKKQEALAQKRDDFRRKLDQLAKQGPVHGEISDSEQPSKRQKMDDAEDSARKSVASQHSPISSAVSAPIELSSPSAALVKTNSEDILRQIAAPVTIQPPQPMSRGGRLPHPRVNNTHITYMPPMAWGPTRFKLDNRTTVFRVLPPFPAAVMEVGVLKDHFLAFGELATIEVDDVEGVKMEGSIKLTEATSVRVSFATRRAAERAFVQGRWLQGQNLQLVWVVPPGTSVTTGGTAPTRTDFSGEKSSPKYMMGLSPSTDLDGMNGNRSGDREINRHGEDVHVTARDDSGVEVGETVTRDEKKFQSTVQNLDWRRDPELQVHVLSKSGRGSGSSAPTTTESAVETVL